MRLLLADRLGGSAPPAPGSLLDAATLASVYAVPPRVPRWVRSNFATSLDGAVTGADGRSGSVNSPADHVVFELLRALSDVVLVGAGTVRAEGYRPLAVARKWRPVRAELGLAPELPLVVVSNHARAGSAWVGAAPGSVLLATHEEADALEPARRQLGDDGVLLCGSSRVDVGRLLARLAERGWTHVLTEGGPHLLGSLLEAGVVDELDLSLTPRVVGGDGPRMTAGLGVRDVGFIPRVLVEEDGTVMGRWIREA